MAIRWVNFRGNAGTVSDAPGDVYNLGTVTPNTGREIGGVYTQGWTSPNGSVQDCGNYAAVVHQSGRAGMTTGGAEFQIQNLVIGHSYNLYASIAGIDVTISSGLSFYSATSAGGTNYHNCLSSGTIAEGEIMDINSVKHANPTVWASFQTPKNFTAVSTTLFVLKNASASGYLNALGIEDVTAGAPALLPRGTMMGFG